MTEALSLIGLERRYRDAGRTVEVLKGVDLALFPGDVAALVGPSGSGKSTLLHLAGLLDTPSGGEVRIEGVACAGAPDRERTAIRRDRIGFVYQFHHLLPDFDALENAAMPLLIAGANASAAKARASDLLERMGLGDRLRHRPSQLSGGERQRCAIARALVHQPALVLADEPTGALDPSTAERVWAAFGEALNAAGAAALIATHNLALAARMPKGFQIDAGRLRPRE